MSDMPLDRLEVELRRTARAFPYPATPDVARAVSRRLSGATPRRPARRPALAWALVALVLTAAGLLSVPEVRAAIVDFIRIGAVRIYLIAPTSTPTATAPAPTPRPTPAPLASVLDLAGQTTLKQAEADARFAIRLPGFPPDLGAPHRVFLQDLGGQVLVLVWMDPAQPDRVRLSLHQIEPGSFAITKVEPRVVQETTVNGRPAFWAEGPYMIEARGGAYELRRLIEGHVLIWTEDGITYRLETDLPLSEAVRVAESVE